MEPNPDTSRLGKGMIIMAWIVFLALLTFVFGDFLEKEYNPNQDLAGLDSGKAKIVELKRNRYGHYVATGRINHKEVTFLLDTGATSVSIPQQVAKRLGLEAGYGHQVQTANGVITVYETEINNIQLGSIQLHGVQANINPHMHGEEVLLGMSFLKELEFSQQGDKLTIKQPYF